MSKRVTAFAGLLALSTVCLAERSSAGEPARADLGSVAEGSKKQLPGGAILRLTPGTRIEIGRSIKLQLAPTGAPQTLTQVVTLISGRLDVDVPLSKVPKTAVLVQGPNKVSAVAKGGHLIAIADANHVTVAAVDGEMLAAAGNRWKPLASGLVRSFVGHDPSYQEHPLPGVPTLTIPKPLLMSLGDDLPSALAEAGEVKEADHYQLSVWRGSDKTRELVRQVTTKNRATWLGKLTPGQYQVTARAVDATGICGQDSSPSSLRVVGASLPNGSRYESGAILLGQRGRVQLLGAAGLEASYGASAHFVAAPDTVGLSRGESTLLRLREPGTTAEVSMALEPRALRADVRITPKHARWPNDMIEVTVQMFDARGRPVPESVRVQPTVLIDVQPTEVTWLRSDNTLHAFIPPPNSNGPWVVRVEVKDEFGDPAGRDFMEIAGPNSERVSAR